MRRVAGLSAGPGPISWRMRPENYARALSALSGLNARDGGGGSPHNSATVTTRSARRSAERALSKCYPVGGRVRGPILEYPLEFGAEQFYRMEGEE